LDRLLPEAKVRVFSGTLAPDAEKDFYARRIPAAIGSGARTIVDVSGEPLRLAMNQRGAVLKMNREELGRTIGRDVSRDAELLAAVREHVPEGGALIVTLGAGGAVACDGRTCWRAGSPRVRAVSAVGSGDSFAAGLAVGLHEERPLPEALRLAIACGAANAMTPRAGFLEKPVVERLSGQVVVTAL
jgi:tagatose 6-phosphate kinase